MELNVTHSTPFISGMDLNNNNTDLPEPLPTRSTLSIWLCSLTVGLICLWTILGNIAVIYAIVNTRQLKDKVSSIFLINLSITDLSSALFVMLSALFCIALDLHRVNTIWCNFMCAMNYCLIIVSMMTLAVISVDRLLSVLFPFKYHDVVTSRRVMTVITFTWIQGLIFGVAPACVGWVHYDYWEAVCAINWHQEPRSGRINYVIVAFVLCFILPSVVILISYSVTIKCAKLTICGTTAHSSGSTTLRNNNLEVRKHNKDDYLGLKTITSMLVVVAAFFVCLTPFSVTKLIKVVTNDSLYVPPYVNLWAAFFGYLSSMVNPFIYGILRADFRRAYKRMFHRIAGRRSYHFHNSTRTFSYAGNAQPKQTTYKYNKTLYVAN